MSRRGRGARFAGLAAGLTTLGLATLGLLLAGCAPALRDPWGLAVARGAPPPARAVPDRFQADLGIVPRGAGLGGLPVTARLYAEPARRYRLDIFGFPSLVAASWLWEDGRWTLVRHDKREVHTGTGVHLEQEGVPLRLPDVHAVLGFLWGAPLPGYPGEARESGLTSGNAPGAPDDQNGPASKPAAPEVSGTVRWVHDGMPWEARFDPATGLCRHAFSVDATGAPALSLSYARHRLREGFVVAGETTVAAGGDTLLTLSVRTWTAAPAWKKDPFVLVVPEGYVRK